MPSEKKGTTWKLARPFYGPYRIVDLTPTNAEVRLVDKSDDHTIYFCPIIDCATPNVQTNHGVESPREYERKYSHQMTLKLKNRVLLILKHLRSRP